MKRFLLGPVLWLMMSGVFSCVTLPPPLPEADLKRIQSRTYDVPYEKAFSAVVETLQDEGYPIATADLQAGIIATEAIRPKQFRSVGMTMLFGSSIRTKWNITVRKLGNEKTLIRARLFFDPGSLQPGAIEEINTAPSDDTQYKPFFTKLEGKLKIDSLHE